MPNTPTQSYNGALPSSICGNIPSSTLKESAWISWHGRLGSGSGQTRHHVGTFVHTQLYLVWIVKMSLQPQTSWKILSNQSENAKCQHSPYKEKLMRNHKVTFFIVAHARVLVGHSGQEVRERCHAKLRHRHSEIFQYGVRIHFHPQLKLTVRLLCIPDEKS